MLSPDDIRSALRDCYDPHLPCNLVDLGVIRSVSTTEDATAPGAGIPGVAPRFAVAISLSPTAPNDEAAVAQTAAQIRNRLAGLPDVSSVDLDLNASPAWTPLDITPEGRRQLGLSGNRNLVQIQ